MKANDAGRARVAVGVSGGGRSLENFLRRQRQGAGYEIAGVIASRPDCRAVTVARDAKLPLFIGDFSVAASEATADKMYAWLEEQRVAWVALAGFLKVFPVRAAWTNRVVNVHPALLPKFGGRGMYGDHVHAAALASGDRESGATIHFVDARYDEGRTIAQARVPIEANDTVESLAARVFAAECRLYPEVLDKLLAGELK